MKKKKTSIVVVDDHNILRYGLKLIIESKGAFSVVDEACDGLEAVEKCALHNPSIILMDIHMPHMNGIEAIKKIKELGISSKIIVLTASRKREHVIAANKLGVKGYLLKESKPSNLIKAIREVSTGRTYLDPEVAALLPIDKEKKINEKNESLERINRLSVREYEVLELIAQGLSNKVIGDELYISEKTVKNHITSIYKKLGVKDRLQAALFAYENIKTD